MHLDHSFEFELFTWRYDRQYLCKHQLCEQTAGRDDDPCISRPTGYGGGFNVEIDDAVSQLARRCPIRSVNEPGRANLVIALGVPAYPGLVAFPRNCSVDSSPRWPTLTVYFFRGRFVGHDYTA